MQFSQDGMTTMAMLVSRKPRAGTKFKIQWNPDDTINDGPK